MKILSTLFIIFLTSLNFSQNYKQVKIFLNDKDDVRILQQFNIDLDHFEITKDNAIITFLNDAEFSRLAILPFRVEVIIDDWFKHFAESKDLSKIEIENFKAANRSMYNVSRFEFGTMAGFYILSEVIRELDSMKILFPNLVTSKISLGNSIQNRPIWMVKISDNPEINENEPAVLYTSLHHAREPQSMMQMIFFMYYLLENYNIDPSVKFLVDNRELYFIPVVNPDGYEHNRTTNPNGGGMWRKNRRANGDGTFGVDLNRNYGPMLYWNHLSGGSSTSTSSDTYRGTAPFSEPETQAIRDFLASRRISNALNYHTFSNLLIFPYGALQTETPDSLIFREFATDMTQFNRYGIGTDLQTVGYATRGNSDDYFYDGDTVNSGKVFAMTPEVGSSSDGFWPAQSRIFPLAQENLFPNLYYAWVAGDYVTLQNFVLSKPIILPGEQVQLTPTVRNKGLMSGSNYNLQLTSLDQFTTVNSGGINVDSVPRRGTRTAATPFSFTVATNANIQTGVQLLFTVRKENVLVSQDTIRVSLGIPSYVFLDTTNNPTVLWTMSSIPTTATKWDVSTALFYSTPNSFTDSRTGSYANSMTTSMIMTNNVSLIGALSPKLSFWTRFDIEANWDYGQVRISTNNGTSWTALAGRYSNLATGSFQPSGQAVYDGNQPSWVKEEINLSQYIGQQIRLRFDLVTDGSVVRDGWYVDDIAIFQHNVIPVELTSFSHSIINNAVQLNWTTASEKNNSGFDIERKKEDDNWLNIGYVEGRGTTASETKYIFVDETASNGKYSYRLKQNDYDGSFDYSPVIEVSLTNEFDFYLGQNFPNPFNPSTTIKYELGAKSKVSLKIYDLLGNEVLTLVDEEKEAGNYKIDFDSSKIISLSSGIYFYTLRTNEFSSTRKMMLMK
ncbi:MAG: hypothetical protein C0425_09985 [Chlorobiaceae bacterium]|nr:hypothetical protein [Chlorobiaceae bacterium]MBA4310648.1 hypothetical protein [Chlorobiaceae bacterium]